MAVERTFIMVKPDGVQRGLAGEVLGRYERRGLKLVGLKLTTIPRAQAEEHYGEHAGKPFYEGLVDFVTSGPSVLAVVEGADAVQAVRRLNGATNPLEADLGTIRGDLALETGRNVVHGSDSVKSAEREIQLFFDASELISYDRIDEAWTRE